MSTLPVERVRRLGPDYQIDEEQDVADRDTRALESIRNHLEHVLLPGAYATHCDAENACYLLQLQPALDPSPAEVVADPLKRDGHARRRRTISV